MAEKNKTNKKADPEKADETKQKQTEPEKAETAEKKPDSAKKAQGEAAQSQSAAPEEQSDLQLDSITEELNATKDLLLRTAAEFDNYKKRVEREKAQLTDYVQAGMVKKLLPVADNIARATAADPSSPEYVKGLEMIVRQLSSALDSIGLKTVDALGKAFDPNFHEAVMHVEDSSLGENVVAEVLQPGYMLGDTVLRPAMVKVAN